MVVSVNTLQPDTEIRFMRYSVLIATPAAKLGSILIYQHFCHTNKGSKITNISNNINA